MHKMKRIKIVSLTLVKMTFRTDDHRKDDDTIMILGDETNAPSLPNVRKMRKMARYG
jgi:hypothetical protein